MSEVKYRVLVKSLKEFITSNQNGDELIEYIKENIFKGDKSIALCFRGQSLCLYYRCHKLLQIRTIYKDVVGEFSFRHSRFSADYKKKEEELIALGVENFNEGKGYQTPIRFKFGNDKIAKNLMNILNIYKGLIDDFVDSEKNIYQWKGPKDTPTVGSKKKDKSKNREKDVQQQIYSEWFGNENKIIYDLEYIEHNGKELGTEGRIDLLGLVNEGKKTYLELIELKSTEGACVGKSGVEKHLKDYKDYIAANKLIEQRKEEAAQNLKLLKEIFSNLIKFEPVSNEFDVRIRFIFSDEAKSYSYLAKNQGVEVEEFN